MNSKEAKRKIDGTGQPIHINVKNKIRKTQYANMCRQTLVFLKSQHPIIRARGRKCLLYPCSSGRLSTNIRTRGQDCYPKR